MWQKLEEGFWQKNRASKVADVADTVSGIIEKVRTEGDKALLELTERFDKVKLKTVAVSREEIEAAYEKVDPVLVEELENSAYNIQRFHEMQVPDDLWLREVEPGVTLGVKSTPLERVGCYIPGGRAAYPSTALMTVIPARVAGVDEVICCTPAPISPIILVAMDIAGADEIYAVGGAQAIAAMALGTESMDIDFPAGPSEIGIIADDSAVPGFIAADFIAQAEHDPSSAAILVTPSEALAEKVGAEVERRAAEAVRSEIIEKALANSGYIIADSLDHAIEIMNEMAPEHLSIQTADPLDTLSKVRNGGSIFVGPYTPVAAGDYASGTNHVLPTAGNAKVASGLNVAHFRKTSTVQILTREGLETLSPTIRTIAEAEGLIAHSDSVKVRCPPQDDGEEDD